MALYGDVVVNNTVRKVRARVPAAGGMAHGNRYVVNTGRTVVLVADMPRAWHGEEMRMPSQKTLDTIADAIVAAGYSQRRNPVCPGCGIMMPATRRCAQCWD